MRPTLPVQRAHENLMQRLAHKVRTVAAKPLPDVGPYHPTAEATLDLHARITELAAHGMTNADIARQLDVTPTTVGYHRKGMCRTVAKMGGLPSKTLSEGDSGKRGFPVVEAETCTADEAVRASVPWLVHGVRQKESKNAPEQSRATT